MDIGFHNCVARALLVHVSAEENIRRSLQVNNALEGFLTIHSDNINLYVID